ncbi:MAG: DNA-directed DNA polymerase II small subunit [Nitrososphaerales archaeon]
MMSNSNKNYSSVQKAVEQALNSGYQINPDAVKLFQKLGEHRGARRKKQQNAADNELSFEAIIRAVIEQKAKTSSAQTIEAKDLINAFPDAFDFGVATAVITSLTVNAEQNIVAKVETASQPQEVEEEVEVVKDQTSELQPTGIEGFSQLFKSRYEKIVHILMERPEGRQIIKISKINNGEKENLKIAGLVFSKRQTKNGIEFTLDDDTGSASVLALSPEAKKAVGEIALDQCVLADVDSVQGRLILKNVIQPDIPSKLASTSKKTVYAIFLSDLHIGSNKFLEGAFARFLDWISGREVAEEDEEIVRRLKYLIIGGDVVDGVGVFPNQEYELAEQNIFKQYEMVSERLKLVPKHLEMFVIPGNHDATRQALPQPMIPRKYAASLYDLPNVRMLGDPCLFKLHGVSILAFHGRSLDDVLATTPGLSYEKPEEAMKVLLRARHLAPIFGLRTPIAPSIEDYLVIGEVPDIFHTGHVHTVGIDTYKSTLMINSGTWQAQTGYQANLGISPRPGLVPIVNLATLEVTLREFLTSTNSTETRAG